MTTLNNFYEKTYNAVWNQYLFLVSSRERIEHKFEILLIIAGALLAVFSSSKLWEYNILNVLPIITLVLIYLLALYQVVPRTIVIPWVSKEEFKECEKMEDSEAVHKQLINEVYNYIDNMNRY